MEGEAFFLTLAQIGLGLAGVTTLVAILREGNQKLVPQDIFGMKTILEICFMDVFLSLIPFVIAHVLNPSILWKVASTVLLLAVSAYSLVTTHRVQQMKTQGFPPRSSWIVNGCLWTSVLCAILQLINIFYYNSLGIYSLGLLWLLTIPIIQFLFFLSLLQPRTE
jgi:hypothetical protein